MGEGREASFRERCSHLREKVRRGRVRCRVKYKSIYDRKGEWNF